jgi:low affinity Fe/Cu permease
MQIIVLSIDIASIPFYLHSSFIIILCVITAKAVKELVLSGQPRLAFWSRCWESLIYTLSTAVLVFFTMMVIPCDWNQGYSGLEVKFTL